MTEFSVEQADWGRERDALLDLRMAVFVDEQKVPPEMELDGLDGDCLHVKASAGGAIIGCARLLPDCHVGRMCVARNWRQRGVGSAIMSWLIDHARHEAFDSLHLNAQTSATPFYLRFGFSEHGETFYEAGIEHRKMTLIIDPRGDFGLNDS